MRHTVIPSLLVALLVLAAIPAAGQPLDPPRVAILDAEMVGRSLRITIVTAGLGAPQVDPPAVTVSAWLDGVPIRAELPLIHMPPRFAMDLDLPAGVVRVGGIPVGTFSPVLPFKENMRFPVEVALSHGLRTATARREVVLLLPTVIVSGYLNELGGPNPEVLAAFRLHGYRDEGPSPTLFWFAYPSRQLTLEQGAQALATYVRRVVLPTTYAAKINVVGYSVGGLLARWNVAYNADGWGTLLDRLILVGVPNEGTVMAYVAEHAPSFLPFSEWGRSPLAHAIGPTFPFWRAGPAQPWSVPPDGRNTLLAQLNARPIPDSIRVYAFYGSHDPRNSAGPQTAEGVTGLLPGAALSHGAGDGVVLAASAQGLPIHGEAGVPALANRAILRVDLGSVYHTGLLAAGADRIAGALLDRFLDKFDEAPSGD